ncbi:hypothetical protein [Lysobacter olei]
MSLERTPAADMIAGTAMFWTEVLTSDRVWDQHRDTPRFRKAFITLGRMRTTWPVPQHFIEALPKVEPLKALPSTPADPKRAQEIIEGLRKELTGDRKTAAAGGE